MGKKKQSAGLLMFHRLDTHSIKVLIAHPGGPIFHNKDAGYWGIPKGEFEKGETPLEAAIREFEEETGMKPFSEKYLPLGSIVQKGGKRVHAWAFEGKWGDDQQLLCNMIDIEWPPLSGKWHHIPEIDEVRMVSISEAQRLVKTEQFELIERLLQHLSGS